MARIKREVEKLITGGKVLKPYGKDGAIKVACENEAFEDLLQAVEFLFITVFGSKVPFKVKSVSPGSPPVVILEGLDNPESARELNGAAFYFLESDAKKAEKYRKPDPLKYLEGYLLIDALNNKKVGVIEKVIDSAGQLLAEVSVEKRGKTHLIPIHTDFIVEMNSEDQVISMNLPEGLLNL